ncbi:MAG: twin-arginine translocation signal domain-containing protein [Gemmataceae bacterium]
MRRRHFLKACGGLAAAGLCVPGIAWADEEATCGTSHGTSVLFVDTPSEAAALAKKQQKLVMVLHVSGEFENSGLT